MRRLGWGETDLSARPKRDPAKLQLAVRLRRETTLPRYDLRWSGLSMPFFQLTPSPHRRALNLGALPVRPREVVDILHLWHHRNKDALSRLSGPDTPTPAWTA